MFRAQYNRKTSQVLGSDPSLDREINAYGISETETSGYKDVVLLLLVSPS